MKIRLIFLLIDILDFRCDPNLKDKKKKKKNDEIQHFSVPLLILHTNIKPANVSDKIVFTYTDCYLSNNLNEASERIFKVWSIFFQKPGKSRNI